MSGPIEQNNRIAESIENRQQAERMADVADGRNDGTINRTNAMQALYEQAQRERNNGDIFKAIDYQVRYHQIGADDRITQPRMTDAEIEQTITAAHTAINRWQRPALPREAEVGQPHFFSRRADDPNRGGRGH